MKTRTNLILPLLRESKSKPQLESIDSKSNKSKSIKSRYKRVVI